MNKKKLVQEFYKFRFSENEKIETFLHPEVSLSWNSTTGLYSLDYEGIVALIKEISGAYASLRTDITHLVKEKDTVAIRFTYFVRTVENPDEELPMARFMAFWEIKDEKLYKGFQISQTVE
ncbi:MAG TPA: nuclear transport factor 2 family protein [Salinimicrobium sp.]|nr:nuclear transport factor 2 family protein [Salinimicrobium sp.]